jgi:SnoaL-like domain
VDEASVRAALECYWRYAPRDQEIAHAMYHDDAVLEFPQSEERFEGKANFIAWRSIYPAAVECKIGRIRGQGAFWVAEVRIRYNGGPWNYGLTLLEFRDDKVARETIYYGEGWQAPQWRAPWRAAWPSDAVP